MYDGLPTDLEGIDAETDGQYGHLNHTDAGEIQMVVGVDHAGVSPGTVADRLDRLAANLPDGVRPATGETGAGNADLGTLTVAVDPAVTDPERAYGRLNDHGIAEYAEGDPVVTPAGMTRRDLLAGLGGAAATGAAVGGTGLFTGEDGAACLSPMDYPELKAESEYGVRFAEQYAPQQVNAPQAWDYLNGRCGGPTPTVAVVDTGVAKHPHLAENRLNDGYDVANDSDDATPGEPVYHFHGTHVAGIAAGNVGTDSQVYPVSDADVLPVKVFGEGAGASVQTVADGIQYAADNGADVANLSLGAPLPSQTIQRAVEYAVSRGTLPVAAAGNAGREGMGFPAGYGDVLAVGATDSDENVTGFSNYGQGLNVVAPGNDVLSAFPEKFVSEIPGPHPYYRVPGTSMSTPAVAGVAALGLRANPDLSPLELKNYIEATARSVDLPATRQGAGIADAAALVREV